MLSDIFNEAYTSDQSLPRVLILLDTYLFFDLDSLTSESATIPPVDDMFCSPYVEMDVETITELITSSCQESILSTRLFFLADDLTAATETLRKVEVGKTLDWQSSRVAWRDANVVAAKWTRGDVSGVKRNDCYWSIYLRGLSYKDSLSLLRENIGFCNHNTKSLFWNKWLGTDECAMLIWNGRNKLWSND